MLRPSLPGRQHAGSWPYCSITTHPAERRSHQTWRKRRTDHK